MSRKIITIHQPDFLPWLGFFDRWRRSDLYVALDDVQFLRRGWHHRDKIKTAQGPTWLTVPVKSKGRYDQLIRDVELDNGEPWRRKHLNALRGAYGKSPAFDRVFPRLEAVYGRDHSRLVDFSLDLLETLGEMLGIKTPIRLSSELALESSRTQRLVDLVKAHGGNVYLTGTGSRAYLEEELFQKEGIEVWWQEFEHPRYPQVHSGFEPGLSAVDYLMQCGGEGLG